MRARKRKHKAASLRACPVRIGGESFGEVARERDSPDWCLQAANREIGVPGYQPLRFAPSVISLLSPFSLSSQPAASADDLAGTSDAVPPDLATISSPFLFMSNLCFLSKLF